MLLKAGVSWYILSAHLVCLLFDSLNESIFQETDAAISIKEIRQRDPYVQVLAGVCIRSHVLNLTTFNFVHFI